MNMNGEPSAPAPEPPPEPECPRCARYARLRDSLRASDPDDWPLKLLPARIESDSARLARIRADREQMELDVRRGNLVPLASVKERMDNIEGVIQRHINNLPHRMAALAMESLDSSGKAALSFAASGADFATFVRTFRERVRKETGVFAEAMRNA